MSTRIADKPSPIRKAPRQARSRATVAAIVEAGAHILGTEGWAGFTTNRVAALAGASIGSLYQYFPDKHSLVDAIRRRHMDESLDAIRRIGARPLGPHEFAVELVRTMAAAHSHHPGLHRALLDEALSSETYRDPQSEFEAEFLGCYARAIAAMRGGEPDATDRLAARLVSDAIDGVIHNAARRGAIGDPELQAGLARMIGLYLTDIRGRS